MEIKGKISLVLFILLLFALFFLAMENVERERNAVKIEIVANPESFSIEEGKNVTIEIWVFKNKKPFECHVDWQVKSNGSTGQLIPQYPSETNKNGYLKAIYIAPTDVNEMEHNVTIIPEIFYKNRVASIEIKGKIYPKLYETKIFIYSDRKKMIAGETAHLKANIAYFDGMWHPFKNATIKWRFMMDGKEWNTSSRADKNGVSSFPFFYSNAERELNVTIFAEYERNLSQEMDFDGCVSNEINIKIRPEKPGDFPVVLIHGWVGSISYDLINFTWYNITKKLEENGFKVLDFDPLKKGIQWLEYQPGWENHHIPWIAGMVSQEIRKALILNGYPPNQTIDIVAHSMGGLVARFMAEHYMADVDYWNDNWLPGMPGKPWYGDGDGDVVIGADQIDDLIVIGTPCHGVPPNINESILQIINYAKFPWWIGVVPDMIYNSPFLEAMGYDGSNLVDYYAVGGDIGWIFGGVPKDFDGDGIPHYSDGLCPTESPYLNGKPLYILTGKPWPYGKEDHMSLIGINDKVHRYILKHLID